MCEEMSSLLGAMEREFAPRLHVMYIDALKDDDPRKKYGVNSLPAQVLLDATGVFLEKHEGVMTRGEILQQFGRHGIELLPATQGSRDDRR